MNKLFKCAASIALLSAATVHADVIGGSLEVSYWQGNYGGDLFSRSDDQSVGLEDELNFDDIGALELAASFEHPVPVLPNIKIKHVDLDESADSDVSFDFDGFTYNGDVQTDLDLTHNDVILYYEVLDNWVMLDLGLDVKIFDGALRIEDVSDSTQADIDEAVPMLYANAAFELPFTGLSAGAELSAISYSGDKLYDGKLRLRQDISLAFIELGYRQLAIDIEDVDDIDVDADISGVYISTGLDF